MKKTFLSLVLLAMVPAVYAQESTTDRTEYKSQLKLSIGGGISHLGLSAFNDLAKANNFPTFRSGVQPTLNLGLRLGDPEETVFTELNTSFLFGSSIKNNGYKASQLASNFDININVVAFKKDRHLLYPSLGIGFLTNKITYSENLSGQSFAQSLQTISGERTFSTNWNIYLNPRIAYDYKLGKQKRWAVGVLAGYRIGLNKPKWKVSDNQKLNDAPKSTASGFYVGARIIF